MLENICLSTQVFLSLMITTEADKHKLDWLQIAPFRNKEKSQILVCVCGFCMVVGISFVYFILFF